MQRRTSRSISRRWMLSWLLMAALPMTVTAAQSEQESIGKPGQRGYGRNGIQAKRYAPGYGVAGPRAGGSRSGATQKQFAPRSRYMPGAVGNRRGKTTSVRSTSTGTRRPQTRDD